MKRIDFNKSMKNLMNEAWRLVKVYGYTMAAAMKQCWAVKKLRDRMKRGVVHFFFIKKSTGELREAFGTLDETRINYMGTGEGRKGNFADCVQYWDTVKNGWRMFKTYNLSQVM